MLPRHQTVSTGQYVLLMLLNRKGDKMDFNDTAAKNIASALRQEASEFVESQRKINQIKEDIKAGVKSPSLPGVNNMLGNLNGEIQSIYQEIMDIASLIDTASEIKRQETEKKRQEEIQRKKEAELKAQQEREEQERLEQEARLKASQQEIQKKVSNKKSTKVNKKSKKSKRK